MNNSSGNNVTNVLHEIARLIQSVSNSQGSNTESRAESRPSTSSITSRVVNTNECHEQVADSRRLDSPEPVSSPLPSAYSLVRASSNNGASTSSTVPANSSAGQRNTNVSGNTKAKRKTSGFVGRVRAWNKDVVCLPYSRDRNLSIPRGKQRGLLAERGLIGKIRLMSTWNVLQVKEEVTSVFAEVFSLNTGQLLDYEYMCVMPGLKRLKRPSVSSTFSWSGQEVASLAGQGSLYIMANTPLPALILTIDLSTDETRNQGQENTEATEQDGHRNEALAAERQLQPTNQIEVDAIDSSDLETLQSMFPQASTEDLEVALRSNATIDFAIEDLLSRYTEDESTPSAFDIAEYFGRCLTGDNVILDINRDTFWTQAFMFYKGGVDGHRPLRVSFGGNAQEIGIDAGGPRREFFQLLSESISSTAFGFFEGSMPNLLPVMKGPSLRLGHFRIVGTMIAHSIINGGIGFPCLARPIFEYVATQNAGSCLPFCTSEMVPNKESRDMIKELSTSEEDEFRQLADRPDVLDYIFNAGWTGVINFSDQQHLLATLLLHEIVWKREAAINQLMQGLKLLNVLEMVQRFPQHFQEKFVHTDVMLTGSVLQNNLEFSETSNSTEQRAKEFFLRYIEENVPISCGQGTEMTRCQAVLQFATGQQSLAGGLPGKISVGYLDDTSASYPSASTCSLKFFLPVKHQTFEGFSNDFDKALDCEAYGFHCF